MNSIRLFADRELNQAIATIQIKRRDPYYQELNKIRNVASNDVWIYDSAHEPVIATKAQACYWVQGIDVRNESVFTETSNLFPLDYFECITCTDAANLLELENANPRYVYTEGGTRFQVFYGQNEDNIFLMINSAFMFTNGPTGPKPGGGTYPAGVDGYQWIQIRNQYSTFQAFVGNDIRYIPSIPKSDHLVGSLRIHFVSNIFRFANDEDPREVIIAVPTVISSLDARSIPTGFYACAYSSDVFEGVEPYAPSYIPTDGNVTRGGTGGGTYPHSPAEGYDNFDALITARNSTLAVTMGNGQGLTYYQMSQASFRKCLAYTYGLSEDIQGYKAESRRAAFVAAYMLPCRLQPVTRRSFYIADGAVNISDTADGYISNRLDHIPFGEISLATYGWDDFNDFTSTSATLLLPFVGRIGIDINAIARGSIRLDSVIDICNGNIAYWVYTSSMQAPEPILYGVYTGNCAIQVPVTGVYAGNVLDKIVNLGSSIINGNPMGMIQTAIDLKTDIRVGRESITDTASGSVTCYQPRLDIERQEMLRAENARDIAGLPGYVKSKLNTLRGFVQVADVDVSGLSCNEEEANEIKALLKEGVYL